MSKKVTKKEVKKIRRNKYVQTILNQGKSFTVGDTLYVRNGNYGTIVRSTY